MAYFIVNVQTGKEYKKEYWHCSAAVYDTEKGAKTACTKLTKKQVAKAKTVAAAAEVQWQVWETNAWNEYKAIHFPVKMVDVQVD